MMKWLNTTLKTPEENIALDEALLDFCEETGLHEVLRFWEPENYFVVLGYSNKTASEVNRGYCRASGIKIIRRVSGGGTVLQGPGCLNYALVLDISRAPQLESITRTNTYVMAKNMRALQKLAGPGISVEGHTDLAKRQLKFSGNAQRRRKKYLLFHGTFLLNFDISMIEKTLLMPERRPAYRQNRSHENFLINLSSGAEDITRALREEWGAEAEWAQVPKDAILHLIETQYALKSWNEKF